MVVINKIRSLLFIFSPDCYTSSQSFYCIKKAAEWACHLGYEAYLMLIMNNLVPNILG
jgi:hypothetical protein